MLHQIMTGAAGEVHVASHGTGRLASLRTTLTTGTVSLYVVHGVTLILVDDSDLSNILFVIFFLECR